MPLKKQDNTSVGEPSAIRDLLRYWREQRGLSQLDLASEPRSPSRKCARYQLKLSLDLFRHDVGIALRFDSSRRSRRLLY